MMTTGPAAFRGTFRTDEDALAVYSEAAGIARVFRARSPFQRTWRTSRRWFVGPTSRGVPLIPRGSGSSMPGGAIGDGVIVDVSRWTTIGEVDVAARTIRVGPGAIRADVDRAARRHGLRFPVDPSSGAFCTIGGMASTNAAGAHSMHFGATRRWVRAIDCVFSDGSRAEIRRGAPPPARIDAIKRLMSVADDARRDGFAESVAASRRHQGFLRVRPRRFRADRASSSTFSSAARERWRSSSRSSSTSCPSRAATSSVLGAFASIEAAVQAASLARAAGAVACELLDRTFLDVAASGGASGRFPRKRSRRCSPRSRRTTHAARPWLPARSNRSFVIAARRRLAWRSTGRRRRSFGSCDTPRVRSSPGSIRIFARCNSSRTVRFRRRISPPTCAAFARF